MKQIRTTRQFRNGVGRRYPGGRTPLPLGSDAATPGVGRIYPGGRTQDRHCAARRAFCSFNKLRVRFVPGTAYKLDGAEFSFHNVTESESVPEIAEVVPSGVGSASGTWSAEHDLNIIGRNLKLAEADVVALYDCTGETPVKVIDLLPPDLSSVTDVMLTIMQSFFETHPTLPAKLGLKVVKKVAVDGVEQLIESNMYVATKAA